MSKNYHWSKNYHCWGDQDNRRTLCGLHPKGVAVTSAGRFVTLDYRERVAGYPDWYFRCPTCSSHPDLAMKLLEELP